MKFRIAKIQWRHFSLTNNNDFRLLSPLFFILLLLCAHLSQLEGCCGGGCGGCCCYGSYQAQQPVVIPVPVPVNNNINNAIPNAGIIGAAARTYRNYYSGSSGGTSGYNTNSNLYSNSNLNALNVLRQQQQAQQLARASSSSSSLDTSASSSQAQTNALLASLLAQMQQQMATTTTTTTRQTTTTTTPTTTTTTTTKPAFDFQAAFAALLAQMPLLRPAPTIPETTTSTTTTTTTTPKPVVLSQEQVDQLRNILAALGGGGLGGALAPARAHVGPKGLADLVAQDAAGGDTTTAAEDVIPEVTEHPPEFASVHPMPSRLLTLLHMADSVDQMNQAQYSRARPLSSRLASMLDPNNTESSQNNNNQTVPGADVPPPPPLLLPPLTKVNVPTPPAEKDPNIIRGNVFAWENGALSLDDLGKWQKEFDLVDLGGFEKLNPAPDDGDEGLDDEQLQGVFNDFYYKLDTYDARGSVENADLGDEAYEQKMEEKAKRRKK